MAEIKYSNELFAKFPYNSSAPCPRLGHSLGTVLLSIETESFMLVGLQMIAKILKITSPGILINSLPLYSLLLHSQNIQWVECICAGTDEKQEPRRDQLVFAQLLP